MIDAVINSFFVRSALGIWIIFLSIFPVKADILFNEVGSVDRLHYQTVYYEHWQDKYFDSLVQQLYLENNNNKIVNEAKGKIFKGGTLLSYGLAEEARDLFDELLNKEDSEIVINQVNYFLAKYYYQKSDYLTSNKIIQKISGEVPAYIELDLYYLATLLQSKNDDGQKDEMKRVNQWEEASEAYRNHPNYWFWYFNAAILDYKAGRVSDAEKKLNALIKWQEPAIASTDSLIEKKIPKELELLSDRSKHALAKIAIERKAYQKAWEHLKTIRTTGLYSNRALLSYAWLAIEQKEFDSGIAALSQLNQRSIANREVQEANILLPHLYEQRQLPRKALKQHIKSYQTYQHGIALVDQARAYIAQKDVPEEFVKNLNAMAVTSDWFTMKPSIDYQALTPFLLDLVSSNTFYEMLKDMGDLYALRDNLKNGLKKISEMHIVLENGKQRVKDQNAHKLIKNVVSIQSRLDASRSEISLYTLSLPVKEQEKMTTVLNKVQKSLQKLNDQSQYLMNLETGYKQPKIFFNDLSLLKKRIDTLLKKINAALISLEPIFRNIINKELDQHKERMTYYAAQTRLAKARLYDSALTNLENLEKDESRNDIKDK